MQLAASQKLTVEHSSDVSVARRMAKSFAVSAGFNEKEIEEIALVASELASNLVRHAKSGLLLFVLLNDAGRSGIRIETIDEGHGIPNVERAIADGFSTDSGLGYGLGTINRLMDRLDIDSQPGKGTHVVCQRWIKLPESMTELCPLSFGAATRPHPNMKGMNGDTFIIKQWGQSALLGLIDGIGHGQWAQRASSTARNYIEGHFSQPLIDIFLGVGRACRPTRGVVMALARFDWAEEKLTFASVGNIELRTFYNKDPINYVIRRGIIGLNAPKPIVTEYHWNSNNILVLHSDGVKTHWRWEDFPELADESPTVIAQKLLQALARDEDDATIIVARGKLK